MKIKVPNLPVGFNSDSFEAFRTSKFRAKAHYNSKLIDYIDSPIAIRDFFQIELIKDKKAIKFFESQNLKGLEIEEAFVSCRYGNYDSIPDLCKGKLSADCPDCGIEDTCPGFNIACKVPDLPGGKITGRELQIIKLIARGLEDKEIADKLDCAIDTVRTHLQRIRQKMEVNNRIEIAIWANKYNV